MEKMLLKNFLENEIIIKQGEVSTSFYRIKRGLVAGIMNYGLEDEYLVEVMKDGRFFGEMGFFAGIKNNYTVVAQTDCIIEKIDREILSEYLAKNPHTGIAIMENMAKSNAALSKHLGLICDEMLSHINTHDAPVPIDLKKKLLEYKSFYGRV